MPPYASNLFTFLTRTHMFHVKSVPLVHWSQLPHNRLTITNRLMYAPHPSLSWVHNRSTHRSTHNITTHIYLYIYNHHDSSSVYTTPFVFLIDAFVPSNCRRGIISLRHIWLYYTPSRLDTTRYDDPEPCTSSFIEAATTLHQRNR